MGMCLVSKEQGAGVAGADGWTEVFGRASHGVLMSTVRSLDCSEPERDGMGAWGGVWGTLGAQDGAAAAFQVRGRRAGAEQWGGQELRPWRGWWDGGETLRRNHVGQARPARWSPGGWAAADPPLHPSLSQGVSAGHHPQQPGGRGRLPLHRQHLLVLGQAAGEGDPGGKPGRGGRGSSPPREWPGAGRWELAQVPVSLGQQTFIKSLLCGVLRAQAVNRTGIGGGS